MLTIAKRGGESGSLVDSEIVFFVNVTDWYSGLNRTGYAGTIMFNSKYKLVWVGDQIRTFKPSSIMKVQVSYCLFMTVIFMTYFDVCRHNQILVGAIEFMHFTEILPV